MLLKPFSLHTPQTLSEALELYKSLGDARLQAGGTFLLNNLKLFKKKDTKTPSHIISLGRIRELKGISAQEKTVTIKSMTTIDEIYHSPLLTDNLSVLRAAAENISTQPIRNMATIGGNLTCRYTWTEMPAVLTALDAQMHFADRQGKRDCVSAQEFFRNAAKTDKILTHVVVQKSPQSAAAYYRVKKTPYVDIPLLAVCVKSRIERKIFSDTIVAVNNGVAFAQRDRVLEDFLNGQACHEGIAEEALQHLDNAIYDERSTDYKQHMFRVAIRKSLTELMTKAGA